MNTNIWHDRNEKPTRNCELGYIIVGILGDMTHIWCTTPEEFAYKTKRYNFRYWAYDDEILPLKKIFTNLDKGLAYFDGFINGSKQSNESQPSTMVDILKLWHDVYEEPEIGSNIIVVDKYGQWWDIQPYDGEYDGYGGLTGWECCVAHYNNIQRWAYIDDLLPKTK